VNVDIISEYQFNLTPKNTHTPISATTTKVTTLNSSSVIYSLTIITSKKNEFSFLIISHQQLPQNYHSKFQLNIDQHVAKEFDCCSIFTNTRLINFLAFFSLQKFEKKKIKKKYALVFRFYSHILAL